MVFSGGPLFPFVAVAAVVPYLALPAVAGTIFTVLLVNVFPARRTRELLGLVGLGAVAAVVLMLRFIRPEQLARPEGFRNFVDYLTVLKTPTSPWLPSEWASEMIMNWLTRVSDPWPIVKLWGARPPSPWRRARRSTAGSSCWATRRRRRAPHERCAARSAGPRVRAPELAAAAEARVPVQGHAALLP